MRVPVLFVVGLVVAAALGFALYVQGEVNRDAAACSSPALYAERIKAGSVPDCRR